MFAGLWSCLAAVSLATAAHAADPVLLQGPQGAISTQDVLADSLRIPDDVRSTVLGSAQNVQQMATSLYIRRGLAEEATKLGMDKSADVQAALKLAQDKVLSDAYLERLVKQNAALPGVVQGIARNIYLAKPEQFKSPEEVRVRHILIDTKGEEGRAQAEKLLQQLKAGANFAELAKTHSADKGSAAKGGDLGFFAEGRMAPEFEKAAFALKNAGDLSGVVQTQFGFHILQLEARKSAGQRSYDEVAPELIRQINGDLAQKARVAAADKIRVQAQPDMPAIEAFAASMTPAAKP